MLTWARLTYYAADQTERSMAFKIRLSGDHSFIGSGSDDIGSFAVVGEISDHNQFQDQAHVTFGKEYTALRDGSKLSWEYRGTMDPSSGTIDGVWGTPSGEGFDFREQGSFHFDWHVISPRLHPMHEEFEGNRGRALWFVAASGVRQHLRRRRLFMCATPEEFVANRGRALWSAVASGLEHRGTMDSGSGTIDSGWGTPREGVNFQEQGSFHLNQHVIPRRLYRTQEEFEANRGRALWSVAASAIMQHLWTWSYFNDRRTKRNRFVHLFRRREVAIRWSSHIMCDALSQDEMTELSRLEESLSPPDVRFYQSLAHHQMRREVIHL
jgi:hypothetical protein